MRGSPAWVLAGALSLVGPSIAVTADETWLSRAADSELLFSAWYEGEELPGRFADFEARVQLNDAGDGPRSLVVEVQVGSADMNDREINAELAEPDWFHAASFPIAEFASSEIQRTATGGYVATGRLRLKGIEKPVELPLEWRRDGDSATLSGSLLLLRRNWQVGVGEWASDASLADRVEVRYRVTLEPGR